MPFAGLAGRTKLSYRYPVTSDDKQKVWLDLLSSACEVRLVSFGRYSPLRWLESTQAGISMARRADGCSCEGESPGPREPPWRVRAPQPCLAR